MCIVCSVQLYTQNHTRGFCKMPYPASQILCGVGTCILETSSFIASLYFLPLACLKYSSEAISMYTLLKNRFTDAQNLGPYEKENKYFHM